MIYRNEFALFKLDDMSPDLFKLIRICTCEIGKCLWTECDDNFWSYLLYLSEKIGAAREPLGVVRWSNIKRFALDGVGVEDPLNRQFKNVLNHVLKHFAASSAKVAVTAVLHLRDDMVDEHNRCIQRTKSAHTLCSAFAEIAQMASLYLLFEVLRIVDGDLRCVLIYLDGIDIIVADGFESIKILESFQILIGLQQQPSLLVC